MITPWAENLALPLLSELSQGVDLQGPPRNAISIAIDNGHGAPMRAALKARAKLPDDPPVMSIPFSS